LWLEAAKTQQFKSNERRRREKRRERIATR
jgi:hypothetical protein